MLSKKIQLKYINKSKQRQKWLKKECLKLWAEIVKTRTGYKCEFPGCRRSQKYGHKIDAHHYFSKGAYPHLKYDIDNGIALCVRHHRAGFGKEAAHSDPMFHSKILGLLEGYKAIRTEQWETLLYRKAQSGGKLDLELELIYLEKYFNK